MLGLDTRTSHTTKKGIPRLLQSAAAYESIGGGSPVRQITDDQARALKKSLATVGQPVEVYVGMRYWYPFTEEAVAQIKRDR